jgi:hypothetical protein
LIGVHRRQSNYAEPLKMSNLFISIALTLLPMGANVTHTDSGTCATDTARIVQVCTDLSDYQTINIGDRYIDVQSDSLADLVANL